MRDLGDLMWAATDERARQLGDLTPSPADLTALRTKVRRRRAVRHVREAAVALPVAVAVVAAGWFGVDRLLADPVPPVTTPEPVPTTDVTPEPTPDPSPDSGLELGPAIEEPGFPPYHEMPDGVLDQAGPGWVVLTYEPRRYDVDQDLFLPGPVGVFLVDPAGTRYLVARLEPGSVIRPVDWQVGEPRVQVITDVVTAGYLAERPEQDLMGAWFDLRTGEFTPAEGVQAVLPTPAVPPTSPRGDQVTGDGDLQGWADTYTLRTADGATTTVAYAGVPGHCSPVGWLDADRFLALCLDGDQPFGDDGWAGLRDSDPTVYAVAAGSGQAEPVRAIGAGDPLPEPASGVWVEDGVVAFASVEGSASGCWTGVDVWDGSGFSPVAVPGERGENHFLVAAQDGVLYVSSTPGCAGDADPVILTAHDRASGSAVVLAPEPVGVWTAGLAGWAVAR